MKLDAQTVVFFDAGHTLLHPKQSVGSVYAEAATHYGVKASADQLDAGFRQAWKQLKVKVSDDSEQANRDEKAWWARVVQQAWQDVPGLERLPFDEYFETVYAAFARAELWSVYPDVWELLDWLQQAGIQCGILSNWDERLRPLLRGHRLTSYFDPILISAEQGVAKPRPEFFQKAEQAVSKEYANYLLVGDDLECDQAGADAAGWHFYHVQRPDRDLLQILSHFKAQNLE